MSTLPPQNAVIVPGLQELSLCILELNAALPANSVVPVADMRLTTFG